MGGRAKYTDEVGKPVNYVKTIKGREERLKEFNSIRNREPNGTVLTTDEEIKLKNSQFVKTELEVNDNDQAKHILNTPQFKKEIRNGKRKGVIMPGETKENILHFVHTLFVRKDKEISFSYNKSGKWDGRFIFEIKEKIPCLNGSGEKIITNKFTVITAKNGQAHLFPYEGKNK